MIELLYPLVEEELKGGERILWAGKCQSRQRQQQRATHFGGSLIGPSAIYRRSRTIYALTTWRVLILRDLPAGRQVTSVPLRFIAETRLRDLRDDGRGTIDVIGQRGAVNARLYMVYDCRRVQEMILDARSKASGPPR